WRSSPYPSTRSDRQTRQGSKERTHQGPARRRAGGTPAVHGRKDTNNPTPRHPPGWGFLCPHPNTKRPQCVTERICVGHTRPMTPTILPTPTRTVDISTLSPHPDNARQGNTDLIAQSLEHNGQYRPLVVQKSTGHVLAGNHTLAAAHQLGWTQVAATFVDVDDTAAKKILLADNKTSDEATYDEDLLAQLLSDLNTTHGTGFTDEEADDLILALSEPHTTPEHPHPDPNTPPPPPQPPP